MKTILSFLLLMCAVGCSHNVVLNPNIQPSAFVNKKIPATVGIIIPDDLRHHQNKVNPSSYAGSGHSYFFNIGEPLSGALMRSVQVAYKDIIEVQNMDNIDVDKVIKFSLKQSNIDVNFQEGFFVANARANCAISVGIEAYDGKTNELVQMTTVNGSGFSSASNDAFKASESFASAAEDAIQQIADSVSNLLVSGFAESSTNQNYNSNTTNTFIIDIIYLKSGAQLEGSIINNQEKFVEMKLQDNSIVKIEKERIDNIDTITK